MVKLSLLLTAIVAATATVAQALPVKDLVLENLGAFSVQCGNDLGTVYTSKDVQALEAKIGQDLAGFTTDYSNQCKNTAFPCATVAGKGTCCSINGAQIWGAHPDQFADITQLGVEGSKLSPGELIGLGQILTTMTPNGPLSTSVSYIAPAYMPASCFNHDDQAAFNAVASDNCLKENEEIQSCTMVW